MLKNFLKSRLKDNNPQLDPPRGPPPPPERKNVLLNPGPASFLSPGPAVAYAQSPPPLVNSGPVNSPGPAISYHTSPPAPGSFGGNVQAQPANATAPLEGHTYRGPPLPAVSIGAAVDYKTSAPSKVYSGPPVSCGPAVDYRTSAPSENYPMQRSGPPISQGPAVAYNMNAPSIPSNSEGPAVAYKMSTPVELHLESSPSTSRAPAAVYELPDRTAQPTIPIHKQYTPYRVSNTPRDTTYGSYGPQVPAINTTPQELPASAVPPRYELSSSSTSTPQRPTSTLIPNAPPREGALSETTRQSFQSPPPPYTSRPVAPQQPHSFNDLGVTKFTLRIYCPRKPIEGIPLSSGVPQSSADFLLAKVALIHVAAGQSSFVSFDVVFGEKDVAIAPYLQKHYVVTPNSMIRKRMHGLVPGVTDVFEINHMKIAFDGSDSAVFVLFQSTDDEFKFHSDFARYRERAKDS